MVQKLMPEILILTESSAPGTPPSGYAYLYTKSDGKIYLKNDAGVETDLSAAVGGSVPDDLTPYGSPPDESLVFAAQSIGTNDFWSLTGDEMRRWLASAPTVSFSTDSRALQAYAFNDTTDRTITINSSSVFAGQQMKIHTVQVSGGTGHKVLLPTGVYFGETGTNRAALFNAVGDKLDAVCFDISGTLRFLYFESGVTFASS